MQKITDFKDNSLLIVDDDNPFRERLARAMEKKGFQVSQAQGVKAGIESVKSKKTSIRCGRFKAGRWKWIRGCKRNSNIKS